MDIMQLLMNQLSGGGVQQISQQVGADEESTGQAVSTAVPLLISALAKNASQPGGADALHKALQDHDGGILDNVMSYLGSGANTANGGAILGHIFGNRQSSVQDAISQKTGLDVASVGRILMMLAPMVMGALGKQQRQGGFDPGKLAGYLNGQHQQMQTTSPDVIGLLTNLLDSNKDGSVIDDIAGKLFGK